MPLLADLKFSCTDIPTRPPLTRRTPPSQCGRLLLTVACPLRRGVGPVDTPEEADAEVLRLASVELAPPFLLLALEDRTLPNAAGGQPPSSPGRVEPCSNFSWATPTTRRALAPWNERDPGTLWRGGVKTKRRRGRCSNGRHRRRGLKVDPGRVRDRRC